MKTLTTRTPPPLLLLPPPSGDGGRWPDERDNLDRERGEGAERASCAERVSALFNRLGAGLSNAPPDRHRSQKSVNFFFLVGIHTIYIMEKEILLSSRCIHLTHTQHRVVVL